MQILRAATLAILSATPALACDLALALAVDVSGSVDSTEYRIQMDGLAAGLRDPVVSEALVRGKSQLMLIQWTGSSRQRITIPWTKIDSFASLDAFASEVASDPRVWRNFSTAIGEALSVTVARFDEVSECSRHLIDLSGDGVSNEGIEPSELRDLLRDRGITVNAIAIEESEPDLTAYFFENVIAGEGAFVVSAAGFADYPERIRKKLLREVTQQTADLD
ncbi:DUF1194 domain-containing protein [Ruegeria arenilitoris]|uniref:DUF1194 domain-containing protein n=1 Tax=Ruegeria arenilitoris TaxID=1173585 RepID=UPI00147B64CA|nr:DUF1194 domain-containing protein [Ruegeria arenilitoris]